MSPTPENTPRRIERINSVFDTVLNLRNFEIQNLSTRNSFILTANIALFAYAAENNNSILLPILGIIVSFLQIRMAAGAKFWQDAWQIKLSHLEIELYKVYKTEKLIDSDNPFIHLFTSKPKQKFNNHQTPGDEKATPEIENPPLEDHEEEMKKLVTKKVTNKFLVPYLITRKFSVSRAPIHLGLWILFFWTILIIKNICEKNFLFSYILNSTFCDILKNI